MAAQTRSFFIASLVIIVSLKGIYARPLNGENATKLDSGIIIVKGDYYALNLYRDKEVETALMQMRKKLESLEERLDTLEKSGMPVSCFNSL